MQRTHLKPALTALALLGTLALQQQAQAFQVRVTFTNLAPDNGVELSPAWVGFHDGDFTSYTDGSAASATLERLAEDGNPGPVSAAFAAAGYSTQGVILGTQPGPGAVPTPIFQSGETSSMVFDLDPTNANSRYISLLSMVVPSNDAFIGNANARQFQLFDAQGHFFGLNYTFTGGQVRDAGTEVNDEIPMNTARLGQTTPNTGTTENGVVRPHAGYISGGNILTAFKGADFTQPGYNVARLEVTAVPAVPEPGSVTMLLAGMAALGFLVKRKRAAQI